MSDEQEIELVEITPEFRPVLRALDTHPVKHEGMDYLLLRDPLNLSGKSLFAPQPIIPALTLMDGTRTINQIRTFLSLRYHIHVSIEQLIGYTQSLDNAYLLESERYWSARENKLYEYRNQPHRPALNAGSAYPDDPLLLNDLLEGYLSEIEIDNHRKEMSDTIYAVLSPHIDFERGWKTYASLWKSIEPIIDDIELAIVFGTDHYSEGHPFSLTRLPYHTPFGTMPTHQNIITKLASNLSDEMAFDGELHHRHEHSIELAIVWLQKMLKGRAIPLVPILCGDLDVFEGENADLENDPILSQFIVVLQSICQSHKTLIIASGDLSHVGPAFGGAQITQESLQQVQDHDDQMLKILNTGDASAFYSFIRKTQNIHNVCGVTPIYLAMRALGLSLGQTIYYDTCTADISNTSFVTISANILRKR